MPKKVFTDAEINCWIEELDTDKPAIPGEMEMFEFPQPTTFRTAVATAGIAITTKNRDGSTTNLLLNPVIARHLLATISMQGQEAGWLDERLEVTSPEYSLDS